MVPAPFPSKPRPADRSACEVSAVVLVHPADDRDDEDGEADGQQEGAHREAEDAEGCRQREHERPPRPRAELAHLGVAVVDVAAYETAKDIEGFLKYYDANALAYATDADGTLLSSYGVTQLSTVVIVDPDGNHIGLFEGTTQD